MDNNKTGGSRLGRGRFQGGIGLFRSFRMASSFLLRIHGFVKHGTFDTTEHLTNGRGALRGLGWLGNYQSDTLRLSQSDTLMDNQNVHLKPMLDVLQPAPLADNEGISMNQSARAMRS